MGQCPSARVLALVLGLMDEGAQPTVVLEQATVVGMAYMPFAVVGMPKVVVDYSAGGTT